jgi:hypothetical protein
MAQENRVTVRFTPTITPTRIELADFESSLSEEDRRKLFDGTYSKFKQRRGFSTPLVMIGKVKIPPEKIKALHVRQEDFTPTISVTFVDDGHIFSARGFPLSNIIVSVFVKSTVKKLKSLSADFLINAVSSMPIPGTEAVVYTFSGEMLIPTLYGNYSKSYRNMTSLETLAKVAEELQLGFADNQAEGTSDAMTWIMPNYTYKEFITQVSKYAYKDDGNFFDCFIDRYYVLNFINVEKQFARDDEVDTGYIAIGQTEMNKDRFDPEEEEKEDEVEVPIILTNYPEARASEFYITDYSLMSNHGDILRNNAIRRYIYWYDHGSGKGEDSEPRKIEEIIDAGKPSTYPFEQYEQFRLHFLEPLTSTVTNDGKKPHTVEIPEYLSNSDNDDDGPAVATGVWSGIDYGNAHPSYKFAELLNYHNWLETEKNLLLVTLNGFSANVIRGSRVKVEIYMDKASAMLGRTMASDQETEVDLDDIDTGIPRIDDLPQGAIRDKALSDFYYVKSISYSYIDGEFSTKLTLARRHWLLPLAKKDVKV